MYGVVVFLINLFFTSVNADPCKNAQVISTSYTTKDATILKQVAFISSFYIKCDIGHSSYLYTVLGDVISPVASVGQGKYQISWTEDVKIAQTGDILVNVYNETGYSLLRKAIRNGETISNVPIFTRIKINHSGMYGGPWISGELVAAAFSITIAYIAIHFRMKLLSQLCF
ncbi:translocon-associated protein subunit delta-like [Diorhabda sublineata]|uniref:translocon-associated protein subunit delta-like n=1 Tax=Diorhabda sublineata TaxID=1163346 RepID=UPI0024E0B29D|nr:translocon-associated protein subunit delta-like [Diorhabda sublineata]